MDEIWITEGNVRVLGLGSQDLRNAVQVDSYDKLVLVLGAIEYSGGGSITIEIWTGMQNQTEDGWVQLAAFSNKTASNQWEKKTFSDPLKFVRWKVTAFTGTSCTFVITGLAGHA